MNQPARKRAIIGLVVLNALIGAGRAAQLPIPCAVGSCGQAGPSQLVTLGAGSATQAGNTLTVRQAATNATFNWQSFNVSADGRVVFTQPSATSVALNRIFQGSPSAIFGQITANGEIYLVNGNGFVFGPHSQVNAAGIIASSLGISDQVFSAGLLAPQVLEGALGSKAALSGDVVLDSNGDPVSGADASGVTIAVAAGARLSAADGGRLLLAAPNVQNAGTLAAPDGQVILAAGQAVYLVASANPDLRGLIVEVDGNGTATNQGSISTPRGNTTLVGLAVNQEGRISATTSVSANGSVILEAGNDTVVQGGGGDNPFTITPQAGGTLELAPGSSIDIEPELSSSATAVPDQAQMPSQITLSGQQIFIHGASITAPNANVSIQAAANPGAGLQTDGNAGARIRIDDGASINVAGSSAELPMDANLLAIQLRANELADDPDQRNGPLRGQTVYVDARVGSPLISSSAFQSALSAVTESVGQRTENGGTVTIESEGDAVIAAGATINVSGGRTTYDGGFLQTSFLVGQNGQLYDIGTANPSLAYASVLNPTFTETFNKWGVQTIVDTPGLSHYEAGYVQGAAAGSITIAAPALVLSGNLIGAATNGALQRSTPVSGGQLIIGLSGGLATSNSAQTDFLAPSVEFVNSAAPVIVTDASPLPAQTVELPTAYLTSGGFTSTKIYSNGEVSVPAGVPLDLSAGGALLVRAARIDVDSSIVAPGGSVDLQSALTIDAATPLIPREGVEIDQGSSIDVSGQWTNDYAPALSAVAGTAPLFYSGGSIRLVAGDPGSELLIGNDVALRANGGAWLQSTGTLDGGAGGSISLAAASFEAGLAVGSGVSLAAFGVNGASGGTFALTAPRIAVENGTGVWAPSQHVDDLPNGAADAIGGTFKIGAALFDADGFTSVSLTANGPVPTTAANDDVLTVLAGTVITAQARSLELDPDYPIQPTGTSIGQFAALSTLPVGVRPVESVSLSVNPSANEPSLTYVGLLDVQTGSEILTDPGASISLAGLGGIYLDGALRAPGGTVSLSTPVPVATPDPGYLPNLRIELGSRALIDASGAFVPTSNAQGLMLGTELSGGTVNLLADRGSVLTDAGSVIDVDGISHPLDVASGLSGGTYTIYNAASAAGSVSISAPESISLLGTLQAHAGVGNYGDPSGGYLSIALTRSEGFATIDSLSLFPSTPRVIEVVTSVPSTASAPGSGLALVGIDQIDAAGFDALRLEAGNEILFSTAVPISMAREVVLDAPAIGVAPGVSASISTDYAELGNLLPSQTGAVPQSGTGTLAVKAQQIDLVGSFALANMATTRLMSSGDITLLDVYAGATSYGSLTLDGNLVLGADRIYPATDTSYTIATVHQTGDPASMTDAVTVLQTGASPGIPLSAGGDFNISADQITSSGTLMAPFGSITLTAGQSLDLESGSTTSVSGTGLTIPYGMTELGGVEWLYTPVGGNPMSVTGIPARAVNLVAPSVTVGKNASVDLAGGGDLYAYEWVPGTGGSVDALGQNQSTGHNTTPGLYAILPWLRGQFAPYDPEETPAAGLTTGQSIYLSGGAGVPAGIYPLLPARDALIPGAYLVQVQSGYQSIVPGESASLQDGTPVVAGYVTFGTTGLHSGGYQGVAIWPGSYGQQLAQYQISDASTFFSSSGAGASPAAAAVRLPADAGTLVLEVSSALDFLGNVVGNPQSSQAVNSQIDISAPQLEITASASDRPANAVAIAGSVIQGWKAGEVVLGGDAAAGGGSVAVTADTVTIDPGATVSADQVLLVANQAITVRSGANVLSTSALSNGSPVGVAVDNITLTGSNPSGAALLAVSDLGLPLVSRPSAPTSGATILVASGATVGSRGALAFDGPGGVTLSGTLEGRGASWSLASSSVGFGGSGDALEIGHPLQAALEEAGAIWLTSDGAITLHAPVVLGAETAASVPTLDTLTLSASQIVNQGGGSSLFAADTLTIEGATVPGAAAAAAPTGIVAGTLEFSGNEIEIGGGSLTLQGFSSVGLRASGAIVGEASGALVAASGNLSLAAPLITASSGGQTALQAPQGTLSAQALAGKVPALPDDLGGELDLTADQVDISGPITVPAGILRVTASAGIQLSGSAVLDVSGPTVDIAGQTIGAEGGSIDLTAGSSINLASGTAVNVAGAGHAPAGYFNVTAGGAVNLQAALSGHAAAGAQGGSFAVNAASLTQGLAPLAGELEAGGFTQADSIHVESGDLTLPTGSRLAANQVTLVTDSGTVDIGGVIAAAGFALRGQIGLFGGAGVVLEPTAALHADNPSGGGGEIDLGTNDGGSVTFAAGSLLSAAGSQGEGNGTLLVRAPISGNDVSVSNLGATFAAFRQIFIEPIFEEAVSSAPTSSDLSAIETAVDSTMTLLTPTVEARLNPGTALPLSLRPAVDLVQSGMLSLSQSLDLSGNTALTGQPWDLTFRVGGAISLGAAGQAPVVLSDGYTVPGESLALTQSASSTFRLVAGADTASPDPLSIVAGSSQSLTLEPGTIVRTGTGDIDLAASGDIVFAVPGVAGGPSASVYTAGINPTAVPSGIAVNQTSFVFSFPTQGGNISLNAGGDIVGAPIQQSVTGWQIREGNNKNLSTQWGVDLDQFGWNVGSLGGGDVSVTAGGAIDEISVAASDSYYDPGRGVAPVYTPSGGVAVTAGGDIGSGQFYIASGTGVLRAGGAFSAIEAVPGDTDAGSTIALGTAQVSLQARTGIAIDAIYNPTATSEQLVDPNGRMESYFFTYGENSAVSLQTTSGDVALLDDDNHLTALLGSGGAGTLTEYPQTYPGTLEAVSLLQDVALAPATLFPTDNGQLEIIAGRDVIGGAGNILMSDAAAAAVPSSTLTVRTDSSLAPAIDVPFESARHVGDTQPALIVAGQDVDSLSVDIPKAADVIAGRDVSDLQLLAQNLQPSDLTLISAGRDVIDDLTSTAGSLATIQVAGPGRLDVLAGRNVNLGFSNGITTVGNTVNANLPSATGADITVIAGLGQAPDYAAFVSKIIAPDPENQALLTSYVESLTGESGLTYAEAAREFAELDSNEQRPLIDEIFFDELGISGLEANTQPQLGFTAGYAAIDALFPDSRSAVATGPSPYSGDISLTFSRIYTTSGGDVDLIAPGGELDVGLANAPASLSAIKQPYQLGIVAQGAGDVNVYTKGDVNVNASRIFTLGGGNILIWSDEGSIDAGRGSKSSVSAPPPEVEVDASGNVSLVFTGAVAGSGIRTIQVDPTVAPGNVSLIAPEGTVNAGDAGIGAAGNINIAAEHVVGLDNIQFGGTSTGVPAQVSNIGVTLSGAANAASSATTASTSSAVANGEKETAAPLASAGLSWLDVFVTGLGEDNCRQDDMECLKRQKLNEH